MADLGSNFENVDNSGSTVQINGVVGTSEVLLPATDALFISEFFIRPNFSNGSECVLHVSIDGTNFFDIAVGEFLSWTPKGNIKQIKIKANCTTLYYQSIFNLEGP